MLGVTHILFGLLVGTLFSFFYGNNPLFLLFATLGALFPDIDHPQSILGRHVKPVGWFAKHRGSLHSLLGGIGFTVLLELLLRILNQHGTIYPVIFLAGYLSHLLLDGSTKGGVYALWPATIKFKGRRKVGSWPEKLLQVLLVVIIIWYWV